MKKFLKWTGIVFLLMLCLTAVFALLGKNETLSLVICNVDLTRISDGKYVGVYDNYRFTNKVEVTVLNHEIINIHPLKIQDGRQNLVNNLTETILEEQRSDIDAISGATASSNGFLKAVEEALKNGVNKP
ncbi:FMN-binding protein [Acetobacterium sp.]|uniref:FMN-binding protein n=1 Tax=Acetobacterium sp. TaxID=1872094 RepID=UPI003593CA65